MKQVKFFLVALMTVVMCMSVTSCMNGDGNTQFSGTIFGKVKESGIMENLVFTGFDGSIYQSKNSVEGALNLYRNDFILAACSFDTEADKDPSSANTYNVTVGAVEKISGNIVVPTTKLEDEGENAMYKSNRAVVSINAYDNLVMLDNYNLIIPIHYLAQEKRDSHTFKIVYYTDETEMKGKTDLKVYLRHTSTEVQKEEVKHDYVYRVFDLNAAIISFKNVNNKYPLNIVIEAEVNEKGNDIPKTTTPYTVSYTYTE